jgi:hypothetical protein
MMKLFFLTLIVSSPLKATVLSQFISSPEGSSLQTFTVKEGKALLEKRSNFFDNKKDYSLGTFELKFSRGLRALEKALKVSLSKIQEADKLLKKTNASFNDLSLIRPHASFLMLDDYRVSQDSVLYPELKKIYDDLSQRKWEQVTGMKLSLDLKTVTMTKDGKEAFKEPFDVQFSCKDPNPPTVCAYKDLGILYIE